MSGLFSFALLGLLSQKSWALPAPVDPLTTSTQVQQVLTTDDIILGVVLIATGLLFTFFGAKLFRPILFLAGSWLFFIIAITILTKAEPTEGWQNHNTIYYSVGIVAAVLGGFLLVFFYKLGLFAVGGLAGFAFAMWILSLQSGGLIVDSTWRAVFIAVMVVLGAIAMFIAEKHVLRIATAWVGSFGAFLGLDCFARTGFKTLTINTLSNASNLQSYLITGPIIGMMAGFILLSMIGIAVQYKMTAPTATTKNQRIRN